MVEALEARMILPHTYILDSSISYLLKDANEMSPKWFSDAIIQRL